ncbi:RNA recognition motif domain-containing protein [Thiococcus pfennigii]|jgi:RNA recognition motif-containing protein|uniref:RNA recognition motif domain-containing protein n=1 Tax=Thiococcus pfennigii TaxID=1057 RepID=UPI00190406D7|nr:RNA-binding protein [Thiococcus pfennigii]MBK1700612.1 hypothetical protein [Thiococcus pfennigii]MBK1732562.1 hypothetical protein [Thiococcus pfennigii]
MAPPLTATLYLTNLSEATTEADLRELFSTYGAVGDVRLYRGASELGARGFGRVDIDPDAAAEAVSSLDGRILKGTIIEVSRVASATHEPLVSDGRAADVAPSVDDAVPSNLLRYQYEVESIERVAMPDDGQGGEWYRYVLASGRTRLAGLHRGTREEVLAYAEGCANDFNLRNAVGKTGRPPITARKK